MLKPMVEVRNEGGVLVAEFWDCLRLDPNPVRDLRQHYEAHLRSKGKPDLVVDLNGVVFAGSAVARGVPRPAPPGPPATAAGWSSATSTRTSTRSSGSAS